MNNIGFLCPPFEQSEPRRTTGAKEGDHDSGGGFTTHYLALQAR